MAKSKKKVVFLDRDGTLNIDHGYVYQKEKWEWTPRAVEALKLLHDKGYTLAIVTNQSGIARGYYDADKMHALHLFMLDQLREAGVEIAHIAFCPHGRPDDGHDCECRKPKLGMIREIEKAIGPIDYSLSWMVGDKAADIDLGHAAGVRTVAMKGRYMAEEPPQKPADFEVDTLFEAAQHIVAN